MRVIAVSTLKMFWRNRQYSDSEGPTLAWYRHVQRADWAKLSDVKEQFRVAGILGNGRVAFNIADDGYRIVVCINYPHRLVYVRFIGTHRQYDAIDAQKI